MNTNDTNVRMRKGSTMLMAILILSTVLIITVSIAEVVRTELILGRNTDYTTFATYAAESQIERGLYQLRKVPGTTIASLSGNIDVLSNGSMSQLVASNNESYLIIPAPFTKDSTVGFDLYDPDTGAAAGKESIKIQPFCTLGWFEVGWAEWTPGAVFNPIGADVNKFRYPCPATINGSVVISGITASKAYRVYVKSLSNTLSNIFIISACNDDAGTSGCNIPGRTSLTANATYLSSTRQIGVSMPRISPVSGIFSYAVFSECQLIKDPTQVLPPC